MNQATERSRVRECSPFSIRHHAFSFQIALVRDNGEQKSVLFAKTATAQEDVSNKSKLRSRQLTRWLDWRSRAHLRNFCAQKHSSGVAMNTGASCSDPQEQQTITATTEGTDRQTASNGERTANGARQRAFLATSKLSTSERRPTKQPLQEHNGFGS